MTALLLNRAIKKHADFNDLRAFALNHTFNILLFADEDILADEDEDAGEGDGDADDERR